MNAFIVALLALVAVVAASDRYYDGGYHGNNRYGYGYGDGFRRTSNGIQAAYNNADRQRAVNYLAERVGASSGTAYRYGVPGTGRYFGGPSYNRGDHYGYSGYH